MEIQDAKLIRIYTYKLIFASLFANMEYATNSDFLNFWHIDNNIVLNKENLNEFLKQENIPNELIDVIISNIQYFTENNDRFAEIVTKYLKEKFTLKNLAKSDLAVIYTAILELERRKDVSEKIIINEAIEITKQYSSQNAYKFVNGILRNIIKEIRNE